MENEFECLADTGDQDLHFAKEFVKKYCSKPKLLRYLYRDSPVVTR